MAQRCGHSFRFLSPSLSVERQGHFLRVLFLCSSYHEQCQGTSNFSSGDAFFCPRYMQSICFWWHIHLFRKQGADTEWPHDPRSGWSFCVTIPSWVIIPEAKTAEGTPINPTVFYKVQVGIQSPQGVSALRGILRRFSDFIKLYGALKGKFRKRIPPPPAKNALRAKTNQTLIQERRHLLEDWIASLLEDIEISRSESIAAFFELEAAARFAVNSISGAQEGNISVVAGSPIQDTHSVDHSQLSYNAGPSSSMASLSVDYASDAGCSTSGVRTPTTVSEIEEEIEAGQGRNATFGQDRISGQGRISVTKGKEVEDQSVTSRQSVSFLQDNGVSDASLHRKLSLDSASDISNAATDSSLFIASGVERRLSSLDTESLKNLSVSLPVDQRGNMKRVLATLQRRFETAKADMEDLITRLRQEVAVKEFLTTKVRDLEGELDNTRRKSQDNLRQAVSLERERVTELEWELEECRTALMNAEESLQNVRDANSADENRSQSLESEMESLKNQIAGLEKQVETLQSEKDNMEAQARAEKRTLAKEIKTLRKNQSALKQELEAANQSKAEIEATMKEQEAKQQSLRVSTTSLVHEVAALRQRLQQCSVDYLAKEDGRSGSTTADSMELLTTSDDRITALLAEAQLMSQDEDGDVPDGSETMLKKTLVDILIENAQLRKAVNSLTRNALVSAEEQQQPARKSVLNRFSY